MINSEFQFRLIARTTDGVVVRRFEVIRSIERNYLNESVTVRWWINELQRSFNNGSKTKRYRSFYNPYNRETHWSESKREKFNERQSMGYVKYIPEADYRRNIPEVIAGTWLQYAGVARTLAEYAAWIKPVEQLFKSGMSFLAKDILDYNTKGLKPEAKTIEGFLNIPKQFVSVARKQDMDIRELESLRMLIKAGFKTVTEQDIDFINRYGYQYRDANRVTPIRLDDFMKFIRRQDTNKSTYSGYSTLYQDYLRFCKTIGYNLQDKAVLFPADLKLAHDREMNRIKVQENEELSNKIRDRFKTDKSRYTTAIGNLIIRPPMDMGELLAEGSAMQHCVGTYADMVAKNKTTILLIRRQDNPEESFYTLEWRDGQVIQCRGKRNCAMTDEVKEFVETWQKIKKLKPKRVNENRRIRA
jgi:hypothetical protein